MSKISKLTYLAILPNPLRLQVAMFAECLFHDKSDNAEKAKRTNAQPCDHVALGVQITVHHVIASVQLSVHRFWCLAGLDIKSLIVAWYVCIGPKGATLMQVN